MEEAQTKLWRAVRREVSCASRVGPSSASLSSLGSGEDNDLTPEFVATAHSVNAALARAVAEEVEEQLTDVLMCLGEETTKASILEHALTHFNVQVPRLLREAGYSPENSPPGSRDESPTALDTATRGSPFSSAPPRTPGDAEETNRFPKTLMYAHLLPPGVERASRRDERATPEPGLATLRAFVAQTNSGTKGGKNSGTGDVNGTDSITNNTIGLPNFSPVKVEGTSVAPGVVASPELTPVCVPSAERGDGTSRSARRRLLTDSGDGIGTESRDDALGVPVTAPDADESPSAEPPSPVEAVAEEMRRSSSVLFDQAEASQAGAPEMHEHPETSNTTGNKGLGTPPEEEGARPAAASSEGWETSSDEDKYGYSSFSSSSETSRNGGRTVAAEAREDVHVEMSRRARARARSRLDVGVGPGPNVVEGYYAGDARRRGARRDPGVGDDAGATVENSTVVAGRETRATESGTLGIIADSDGGSQSIIYAPYEAEKKEARAVELKPATGAAAALQKIATTMRNVKNGFQRPKLITMPVRQRHWMEIHESTF